MTSIEAPSPPSSSSPSPPAPTPQQQPPAAVAVATEPGLELEPPVVPLIPPEEQSLPGASGADTADGEAAPTTTAATAPSSDQHTRELGHEQTAPEHFSRQTPPTTGVKRKHDETESEDEALGNNAPHQPRSVTPQPLAAVAGTKPSRAVTPDPQLPVGTLSPQPHHQHQHQHQQHQQQPGMSGSVEPAQGQATGVEGSARKRARKQSPSDDASQSPVRVHHFVSIQPNVPSPQHPNPNHLGHHQQQQHHGAGEPPLQHPQPTFSSNSFVQVQPSELSGNQDTRYQNFYQYNPPTLQHHHPHLQPHAVAGAPLAPLHHQQPAPAAAAVYPHDPPALDGGSMGGSAPSGTLHPTPIYSQPPVAVYEGYLPPAAAVGANGAFSAIPPQLAPALDIQQQAIAAPEPHGLPAGTANGHLALLQPQQMGDRTETGADAAAAAAAAKEKGGRDGDAEPDTHSRSKDSKPAKVVAGPLHRHGPSIFSGYKKHFFSSSANAKPSVQDMRHFIRADDVDASASYTSTSRNVSLETLVGHPQTGETLALREWPALFKCIRELADMEHDTRYALIRFMSEVSLYPDNSASREAAMEWARMMEAVKMCADREGHVRERLEATETRLLDVVKVRDRVTDSLRDIREGRVILPLATSATHSAPADVQDGNASDSEYLGGSSGFQLTDDGSQAYENGNDSENEMDNDSYDTYPSMTEGAASNSGPYEYSQPSGPMSY